MKWKYNEKYNDNHWLWGFIVLLIILGFGILLVATVFIAPQLVARNFNQKLTIGARVENSLELIDSDYQRTVEHEYLQGSSYERN